MKAMFVRGGVILSLLAALVFFAGCSGSQEKKPQDDNRSQKENSKKPGDKGEEPCHVSEDGFWCTSHGIPEHECSMCSARVEKECKAKGDWCEQHNRAKSQCFICNPKLKEKYDRIYQARYGKKPPLTDDEKEELMKKQGNKEER